MKIGTRGFCALLCILCLLLVGGCGASAKTGDVFFTDLNQADRIIISVEPQANPKVKSPAKICTRESDLAALKETIGQFEIGQTTETIYGGENIVILLYQGDTLLHRITLHDNGYATIDGTSYICSWKTDFTLLYGYLGTGEKSISLLA